MRNFIFIASCITALHISDSVFCQCTIVGPNNGSVFANDAATGTLSWNNTGNAQTSNNQYASASIFLFALSSVNTEYITAENFGFNISPTASICGIQVDVEHFASGITNILGITLGTISDNSVMIVKNGVITGSEHKSAAAWTGTNSYVSYGSAADTWGISTWLPSDINANNFGVAISANLAALVGVTLGANIDHIRITINYVDPPILSLMLQNFSAIKDQNNDLLSWTIQAPNDFSDFIIQRSENESQWQNIGRLPVLPGKEQYAFTDELPLSGINYYRLQVNHKTGPSDYSPIQPVFRQPPESFTFFPNPASTFIHVQAGHTIRSLAIKDMEGRTVKWVTLNNNSESYPIDVSDLARGIYFLQANNAVYKFLKN